MGKNESRLYGIGAALDVAGTRFSAALVMIAYLMVKNNEDRYKFRRLLYIISFLIIAIVGNMMARTTTLGVILSLLYWVYVSEIYKFNMSSKYTYIWRWFLGAIIVGLPALVYLYLYNQNFYENIRFGFEGFFSLAETGRWEVSSNDILKNMYVFPDNFKTWVIGDGYIVNPKDDPYYTGPIFGGYYMGTDVGYLRFIFYFGLTGLIAFISYIYKSANICNIIPSLNRLHAKTGPLPSGSSPVLIAFYCHSLYAAVHTGFSMSAASCIRIERSASVAPSHRA